MRYREIAFEAGTAERQVATMKAAARRQQQTAERAKKQAEIADLRQKLAKKQRAAFTAPQEGDVGA